MKFTRLLAIGAVFALAACSKPAVDKPTDAAAAVTKPPIVTVNGTAISPELYEDYVKMLTQGKSSADLSPEDREQIKENLVRIELIAQQAEKDGTTKDSDVANRLALSRIQILQQAAAQKYLKAHVPTDAELHAEFDEQIKSSPAVEYKARHILVKSPDVAQKIIEQLKHGENFASLAKKLSSDTESAKNGGDLGWFAPGQMVKPFSDAVALLKKGEYTTTPVQSQFGYHVIQLEDTRDTTPPAFDAVKDRISQIVVSKKFKAYSDDMLKTAKIEPPLTTAPPPSAAGAAPAAAPAPAPAEAPKN